MTLHKSVPLSRTTAGLGDLPKDASGGGVVILSDELPTPGMRRIPDHRMPTRTRMTQDDAFAFTQRACIARRAWQLELDRTLVPPSGSMILLDHHCLIEAESAAGWYYGQWDRETYQAEHLRDLWVWALSHDPLLCDKLGCWWTCAPVLLHRRAVTVQDGALHFTRAAYTQWLSERGWFEEQIARNPLEVFLRAEIAGPYHSLKLGMEGEVVVVRARVAGGAGVTFALPAWVEPLARRYARAPIPAALADVEQFCPGDPTQEGRCDGLSCE